MLCRDALGSIHMQIWEITEKKRKVIKVIVKETGEGEN